MQDIAQWGGSKTGPFIAISSATSMETLLGGSHPPKKILAYVTGVGGDKLAVMGVNLQRFAGRIMMMRRPGFKIHLEPVHSCDGPIEQLQPVYEFGNKKSMRMYQNSQSSWSIIY